MTGGKPKFDQINKE